MKNLESFEENFGPQPFYVSSGSAFIDLGKVKIMLELIESNLTG